jgi:hypothetical protein
MNTANPERHVCANSSAFSRPAANARTRRVAPAPCTGAGIRRQPPASASSQIAAANSYLDQTVRLLMPPQWRTAPASRPEPGEARHREPLDVGDLPHPSTCHAAPHQDRCGERRHSGPPIATVATAGAPGAATASSAWPRGACRESGRSARLRRSRAALAAAAAARSRHVSAVRHFQPRLDDGLEHEGRRWNGEMRAHGALRGGE